MAGVGTPLLEFVATNTTTQPSSSGPPPLVPFNTANVSEALRAAQEGIARGLTIGNPVGTNHEVFGGQSVSASGSSHINVTVSQPQTQRHSKHVQLFR